MKSIELFCASPASTAICSSMDQRAIIRPGIRSIDRRHIHRLGDTPRPRRTNAPPCSSHLPFDPSYHKARKSSAAKQPESFRRKSSADADTSSRYLLSDKPYLDPFMADQPPMMMDNPRLNLEGFSAYRSLSTRPYQCPVYTPSPTGFHDQVQKSSSGKLIDHLNAQRSSLQLSTKPRQVVELRVSIHCKGCEGKLRKYITRMEGNSLSPSPSLSHPGLLIWYVYAGVTSFSIDLATKKVTIIGDVTAQGVLASISKVKNAQIWPSPTSSSSSSSTLTATS